MRTREYVAWGVVVGMLLALVTTKAVFRGPTLDAPGEATTSVFGVVVDRVSIPADRNGRAVFSTDRVQRGLLVGMALAAVVGGAVGGLLGWAVRVRRPSNAAEPGTTSDGAVSDS